MKKVLSASRFGILPKACHFGMTWCAITCRGVSAGTYLDWKKDKM